MTNYTPTGQIAMSQVNQVFGRGFNLNAYRNTTWVDPNGGSGVFSAGTLGMSALRGKAPFWFFGGNVQYFLGGNPASEGTGGDNPQAPEPQTYFYFTQTDRFVGPHHNRASGGSQPFAIALDFSFSGVGVQFPNGRPSTFCRIRVPGLSVDFTMSNYSYPNFFGSYSFNPAIVPQTTQYTEIYLFN